MRKLKKLLSMIVALCILITTFLCVFIVANAEDTAPDMEDIIPELNFGTDEILITVDHSSLNSSDICGTISNTVESYLNATASFAIETEFKCPIDSASSVYMVDLADIVDEKSEILDLCESINLDNNGMYAEPNYILELTECSPEDEQEFEALYGYAGTSSDWFLRDTWAKEAATISQNQGDDIVVAVIDTGCNFNHEHLQNSMVSFEVNDVVHHGYNVADPSNPYDISDNFGHGTAVSSVISGANSGGSFTGVARNSKILPIKISDQKTFETDIVLDALNRILSYNTYVADNGINAPEKVSVVNMSFSFTEVFDYKYVNGCLKKLIDKVAESCILVAAAGNNALGTNTNYSNYPASYDSVIGVMAYAPDLKMASYSSYDNRGSYYEVAAPGTYIKAANHIDLDGYKYLTGTSFSSPIVAGAIALYLSNFPTASIERTKSDLLNSMVDTVEPYRSKDIQHFKLNIVDFLNLGILNESSVYSEDFYGMTWSYNHNNRTLTFEDSEELFDCDMGEAPWYRFRNLTNSCIISDDIIYVGSCVLYNFLKMESLTIGSNVEYIGEYACHSCEKLEAINIPSSVTEIGMYAFSKCSNATTLSLPPVIEYYNPGIFENCSSLITVLIPSGWTEVPSQTFRGCDSLQFVALPDTLTKIGATAFRDCSALSYISLPNNIYQIGGNAFVGCSSLTSIIAPRSLTTINISAFSGCTNLNKITLFDNLITMRTKIFDGCPNVVIKAYVDSTALEYAVTNNIDYEIMYRINAVQGSGAEFNRTAEEITGLPPFVSTGTFEENYICLDNGFTLSYEGLVSGYITQETIINVMKNGQVVETYTVR
ncbi:MAG: leucine-rich repeat protein [Clostridia bacterium]|nr:leucine-rich repeat protein [Clostridia bacterium]